MKKAFIALIVFLISVFIIFSFWDYNSDYVAEKTLWKINRQYMPYLKEPAIVPKATFNQMIQEYEKFILRFPDSKLVPLAQILIGRVFSAKEEYASARARLEEVIRTYPNRIKICVEALLEVAHTYKLEKDNINVLRTYRRIVDEYPLTDAGLQAPLLIAQFFAEQDNIQKAQESFDEALMYYQKLAQENQGTFVEFNALRLIANCYTIQQKWEEAVMTFGDILLKFPGKPMTSVVAKEIVRSINNIAIYEMKDYDLPISIYNNFIKEHPNHPLLGTYKAMIQSLNKLKEKSTEQPDGDSYRSLENDADDKQDD